MCPVKGKFDSQELAPSGPLLWVSQMGPLSRALPLTPSVMFNPEASTQIKRRLPSLVPAPVVVVKMLSQ